MSPVDRFSIPGPAKAALRDFIKKPGDRIPLETLKRVRNVGQTTIVAMISAGLVTGISPEKEEEMRGLPIPALSRIDYNTMLANIECIETELNSLKKLNLARLTA